MAYYSTGGQFGGGYQNPQFGQWAPQSPTPWNEDWWKQASPQAAISGAQNDIRRNMYGNFNAAANRLGASGGLQGTPYKTALTRQANDSSRQMAEVANKYTYDAANQEANRRLSAWESGQGRQYGWASQQAGAQQETQQ